MDKDWSWKHHVDQLRLHGDSPLETLTLAATAVSNVEEPEFEENEVLPEQLSPDDTVTERSLTKTVLIGNRYPQ